MVNKLKFGTLLLVFYYFCLTNLNASPTERFETVTNLKTSYSSNSDKLKITWTAVSGASSYRVTVKDSDGEIVKKAKTKKTRKRIKGSLFRDGSSYKILVKVLKTSEHKASKNKKLNYTHGEQSGSSGKGTLQTTNSAGRSGTYYLPSNYNNSKLPLMLAYHGSGGSGSDMVNTFSSLAEEHGFIIVAPDSRKSPSGSFTWEVGTEKDEVTPDYTHALDCLSEVLSYQGVKTPSNVLAVGYSGGASSSAYIATNDSQFDAFAVLHGGIFTSGFGERQPRAWLSTGKDDTLRPPSEVKSYKTSLEALGFAEVSYQSYSGGHELSSSELNDLVDWWLSN